MARISKKRHIFFDKYAKIRKRILMLSLAMTFVALGVGLGLQFGGIQTVSSGLETIYADRIVPLQQLKVIFDMYAVNIVDTAHRVLNGNISWTEGRTRIDEASRNISEKWNDYLKTALVEEEKRLIFELSQLSSRSDTTIRNMRKILQKENPRELAEFVKKELYPNIQPVHDKVDALFNTQVLVAKEIYDRGKLRCRFSRNAGLVCIILSLVLSVFVTLNWKWVRTQNHSF